jgi:hypothetical protein
MPITGLQLITVTGKYLNLSDGSPANGKVEFTPTTVLRNTVANEIIYPFPIVANLSGSGTFSIQLPATDDPDITPQGWLYSVTEKITEKITGSSINRTFTMAVPYDSPSNALDMADVIGNVDGALVDESGSGILLLD